MTTTPIQHRIRSCIADELARECRELYLGLNGHIDELYDTPTAVEFLRYVAQNRPFVVRRVAFKEACKKWAQDDYLLQEMADARVTVSITPDGWADAVKWSSEHQQDIFTLPFEEKHPFKRVFEAILRSGATCETPPTCVHYVQTQNNCMREEYPRLMKDLDQQSIESWATEALGHGPDAVNFWMGNGHSTTSLHKDNYENLYSVIRGRKRFTLYPPTDCLLFPQKKYPVWKYAARDCMTLTDEGYSVPWYPREPEGNCDDAKPIVVDVGPGDVLYLPALFYHQVGHCKDEPMTIAVNYWYDMLPDQKLCWLNAVSKHLVPVVP